MEKIVIEAVDSNLGTVNEFIEGVLEAADCPMKALMQIELAVEEIFVNICHYAYAPETGEAEISVGITEENSVMIVFSDSGIPYDPLAKDDPDISLSVQERAIGGLGIFMVKKYMDEVIYDYSEGRNNLTLIKRL